MTAVDRRNRKSNLFLYGNILSRRPTSLPFSPLSLFTNGEQGVWYDPSDMSTLFQERTGATPVTAVEQPVGLMLDKSKGLAIGTELVTNGDFSNGTTGWGATSATISASNGGLLVEATGGFGFASQTISTVVGRTYLITADVTVLSGPWVLQIASGNLTGSGNRLVFRATNTTETVRLLYALGSGSGSAIWDNVSVRELSGNHAMQATDAARPVLSARVNLLTKTEAFDDAVWPKSNATVTANATTAPDGTTTADQIVATLADGSSVVGVSQFPTLPSAQYRFSLYAKAGSVTKLRLAGIASSSDNAFFDLSAGTVLSAEANVSAAISSVGDGWYRCSITATGTAGVIVRFCSTNGVYQYTGSIGDNLYIWGADLRVANDGVNLPAYQRVNTETDYDTAGFPMYLRFDGTDDSMATASIDFTDTDKMTVFAGVRKLSDATAGLVAELSATSASNVGSFGLLSGTTIGDASRRTWAAIQFGSSLEVIGSASVYSSPETRIATALLDRAEAAQVSEIVLRLNGSAQTLTFNNGQTVTGNYGNYPLYIGSRGGSSVRLNGRLYSLIVRGASTDATAITNAENWVNLKTRAF